MYVLCADSQMVAGCWRLSVQRYSEKKLTEQNTLRCATRSMINLTCCSPSYVHAILMVTLNWDIVHHASDPLLRPCRLAPARQINTLNVSAEKCIITHHFCLPSVLDNEIETLVHLLISFSQLKTTEEYKTSHIREILTVLVQELQLSSMRYLNVM